FPGGRVLDVCGGWWRCRCGRGGWGLRRARTTGEQEKHHERAHRRIIFGSMPDSLAKETSPYLRQHADNPVDWYAWGEEAFRKAREEDKPIHLSVGYAACHWCHVMAHESFEDPKIAALMNERYVNIKVDRQERPDVDDIYQKVVQMMGQGGGWPLTVFLTPDRVPFFGGTYFPPEDRYGRPGFPRLIVALSEAWKNKRQDVLENA